MDKDSEIEAPFDVAHVDAHALGAGKSVAATGRPSKKEQSFKYAGDGAVTIVASKLECRSSRCGFIGRRAFVPSDSNRAEVKLHATSRRRRQ
jgi:hypothetical protein